MAREIDVDEVERLAARASKGRWEVATETPDPAIVVAEVGKWEIVAPALRLFDDDHDAEADAAFIAAMSPMVVERMAGELRAERAETDLLTGLVLYLASKLEVGTDVSDAPPELRGALMLTGLLGLDDWTHLAAH